MGRAASIERALRDVVELRTLARGLAADAAPASARLTEVARRRSQDIGPSVPKTQAAALLGVSLTTLDKWIERGALPVVRRDTSSRGELQTESVLELALHVDELRAKGVERGRLAAAIALRDAAPKAPGRARMGTRGYFPDERLRRDEDLRLTPAERVAEGIKLSRVATRVAVAAADSSRTP